MTNIDTPDATRKLTITANSVHGEKEVMWAMRATDLILALYDIRETFVRLRNDGVTDEEITFGEKGYDKVAAVITSYNLTDLLDEVC
jgi:hypothetical protein